jgi:hypothetical protein
MSNIPEIIFDQINGPKLIILNADGVTTSSVIITDEGKLAIMDSAGGSSSVTVETAATASYLSGSVETASYVNTANLGNVQFTGSVSISGSITHVDDIQFRLDSDVAPPDIGELTWDIDDKTLSLGLEGGSVLQIGQEVHVYVENQSGENILNGQVVRIAGSYNNHISGKRAIAGLQSGPRTSIPSDIVGVATQDIVTGSSGYLTTLGLVHDIDTQAFPVGSTLYVSHENSGSLIDSRPTIGFDIVPIATVITSDPSGSIFVNVRRSTRFDNITGVDDSAAYVDGQMWKLINDGGTFKYIRTQNFTGSLLGTSSFSTTASYALSVPNQFKSGDGKIYTNGSSSAFTIESATNPSAGYVTFGSSSAAIGISDDGVVGSYDYNGAMIFRQADHAITSHGEFIFVEKSGAWRFAMPKSAAGLGTYNPRSMIIAGPSPNSNSAFSASYWGFDKLVMNTSAQGADLGVQNDLQVLGKVYSGEGFTGSLNGTASLSVTSSYAETSRTASFVTTAQTASFVATSSWSNNAITASFIATASWSNNARTASFVTTAQTASFVATASWSNNARTASFVTTAQTASFVATASWSNNARTASFVSTSSWSLNSITSSFAASANSSSYSITSSFASSINSGAFALTGSTNTFKEQQVISGGILISSSWDTGILMNSRNGLKPVANYEIGYNNCAGVDDSPVITDLGNGTMSFDSAGSARLYATTNNSGKIVHVYMPAQQVILPANVISYVNVEYVSGQTAQYKVTIDPESRNGSNEVIFLTCFYYTGGSIQYINRGQMGRGMPNKHTLRMMELEEKARVSGLNISVSGSTGVVELTAGRVYVGLNKKDLPAVKSDVGFGSFFLAYHSASIWKTAITTTASFTKYDDGTNLQPIPSGGYGVIWVYKYLTEQASGSAIYLYGPQSGSAADALAAGPTSPPDWVDKMSILCGKIVFESGSATPYTIESAFVTTFTSTPIARHGDLSGLTNDDHPQYLSMNGRAGIQQVNDSVHFIGSLEADTLIIGTGSLFLPDAPLNVGGDVNSYFQSNFQNANSGTSASTDLIIGNDLETDAEYYLDIGINSSTYNVAEYSFGGPNDSYVMAQTSSLILGIYDPGAEDGIIVHVGGGLADGNFAKFGSDHTLTLGKVAEAANATLDVSGSVIFTGSLSVTGGITGSITTASYVRNAVTASYVTLAQTASYVITAQTASFVTTAQTASFVATASWSNNARTASFITTAQTASYVKNADTASYVVLAQTASYVLQAVSASFATNSTTASYALVAQTLIGSIQTASYAFTASFVALSQTASFVATASWALNAVTASFVATSSWSNNSRTASFVATASWALNAVTASFVTTSSWAINSTTASFIATASWAFNAVTASFVRNAVSASYLSGSTAIVSTLTASFISASIISASKLYTNLFTAVISTMSVDKLTVTEVINGTASLALTSSYALNATSASFALTSSYALNAITASYVAGSNVDAFAGTHDGNQVGNIIYNDHFLATTAVGETGWTSTVNNGATGVLPGEPDHPGILTLSTGTNVAGRATSHKGITSIEFGVGTYRKEMLVRVPILSNGTQRFVLRLGFGDNTGAGDNTDGVYFEYTDTASPNWMIRTARATVRTTQTSSIAVATNTWQKLGIIVQGTASASFYVNDVQAGTTITTNIPSGSAAVCGILNKIEKSVGTTARLAHIDYSKLAYY